MMLNHTFVDKAFRESAPKMSVITDPKKTYIRIIDIPYIIAFLIPLALVLLCFVKKLTVIGIIGKTQGVSKAAKPDKNAIKNIVNKPVFGLELSIFSAVTIFESVFAVFSVIKAEASISFACKVFKLNSKYLVSLMQLSLHTW